MPTTPDNNYARHTNHDYIGSFGRIPNEPKSTFLAKKHPFKKKKHIWSRKKALSKHYFINKKQQESTYN